MLPVLGAIDKEKGEFWTKNPFLIPDERKNLSAFERNKLYVNLHGQSFLDASFASKVDLDSDSRTVIAADFDRDGAPDLLVASVGGGPLRLFRNRYPQQNRLVVKLHGIKSNRSGIGVRVAAECGNHKVVRDVFPANGFMGPGPAQLSLGLGDAKQVERLSIRWPTGETQVLRNIAAPATILVEEGNGSYQVLNKSK